MLDRSDDLPDLALGVKAGVSTQQRVTGHLLQRGVAEMGAKTTLFTAPVTTQQIRSYAVQPGALTTLGGIEPADLFQRDPERLSRHLTSYLVASTACHIPVDRVHVPIKPSRHRRCAFVGEALGGTGIDLFGHHTILLPDPTHPVH
jgi:hypothetical protein